MSSHIAEVVEFTLEKHPNADRLSIAKIKGWTCVVKTEDFVGETLGVYIPLDMVASVDHPLLGFMEGKRVKTVRLRQVYSQGILLPLGQVVKAYLFKKYPEIGDDLTETLGIRRYEPPIVPGKLIIKHEDYGEISTPDWLNKYTDIENWNHWPNIIQEGEEVHVSEKLHGSSARYALIDGKYYIGSRNRCLRTTPKIVFIPKIKNRTLYKLLEKIGLHKLVSKKKTIPPEDSGWHRISKHWEIEKRLRQVAEELGLKNIAVFGEITGVQDLMYGLQKGELDFYSYDIKLETTLQLNKDIVPFEGEYASPELFDKIVERMGLKKCPVLYKGSFIKEVLDLRFGKDTISKSHVREGIVIKPMKPRVHERLGRVILKRVSEDYLMRKNAEDNQ